MTATGLLIWIILLLLLGLLIFLPSFGMLARWRAYRINRQREQVEDALKHLLNREQSGRHASPESIAGGLQLSLAAALRLVDRMETQELLQSRPDGLHLTPQGERWALQVVRAHRLWERYLAYEARLPLEKVHGEAHRHEHHMTVQQVDDLDARLGYPRNDPHGDPIPSRDGVLAKESGKSLTDWPVDTPGKIVHLEDEPPVAYAQILAEGLRLSQVVRVLETSPERILLSDGESEYRLAPSVAANVFVVPIPTSPTSQPGVIPLSELADGRQGEVVALDEACQGFTRRRLLDLGMTPGAQLVPEMRNFFGDPRAYRIRGTLIALRKEQAGQVWVRPLVD
jgi:DtxR family transcriptional regulator, Mn-dependent transcriptional regulator